MKRLMVAAAALGAGATMASAGGIERANQSVGVLFEQGRYMEFGLATADPTVSGIGPSIVPMSTAASGDISDSYLTFGAAYKADLNDRWSYALIYNQPFGASVTYPGTFGVDPYLFAGSNAELTTHALTGLLQYNLPSNISVYGGLRAQTLEANVEIPFISGYTAATDRDVEFGYVLGTSYERPDIALRVSLTYNSAIEYNLSTEESGPASGTSDTPITTPQSLHLEFQTGVAADTLLFGGVRWVDWTEFSISPDIYMADPRSGGRPLVSYADDRTTFTLGLGRRLSEAWSVAASVSYEESTGSITGNLGPTDGLLGVTLGGSYTKDNVKITGGISYIDIGNATTTASANFTGNSAIGAGVKVGYSF